jgi:hypothetical protein
MAVPPVLALPSLDDTFGAVFIGVVVSSLLFGVTCLQLYDCFPGLAGLVVSLTGGPAIYSTSASLRKA